MATWDYDSTNNTATCTDAAENTTIKVKGVKSKDGLSIDETNVVVSYASLGTNEITITCGKTNDAVETAATTYALALGADIPTTTKSAAWSVSGTTATYGTATLTNYKLDGGAIKYDANGFETPVATYATVAGLKSGLNATTAADALKVSGTTITVNADAFDATSKNSKVTLTNGKDESGNDKAYKLAVDANVNKETVTWVYSGEQATYKKIESFNFAANDAGTEIAAKNPTAKTVDLAVVSGLRKGLDPDAINTLLKVEGNTITVNSAVFGAKNIKLTNKNESKFAFAVADGTYATGKEETPSAWIISGATAKYYSGKEAFDTTLAYKVSKDEISYTAPKAAKGADPEITITNLASGIVHDAKGGVNGLSINGSNVTISPDLFNKKTIAISGDYKLIIDENYDGDDVQVDTLAAGAVGYEVSNTTVKFTATLSEDSYTLSSSGKSILYSKNGGDTLLATISGVQKNFDEDIEITEAEHISFNGTTVTLGSAALGKGKVSIKGDGGFVLGLNTNTSSEGYVTPAVTGEAATWTVTKTKAEYGIATSEGYQLAADGSSIAPVKASVKAQATITGVNENLPAIAQKTVGGADVEEYVKAKYASDIQAALDSGDYTEDEAIAKYCNEKKSEYDTKIAAEIAKYIVVDSTKKTITLKPQAVGTAAIKLKIANGADDYNLALDNTVLQTEAETKKPANLLTTWEVKGANATYQTYYPAYYVLSSSKAGVKDVKYNKAVPVSKTPDIALSGLVKGLSVVDKAIDGITINSTTKVVTLDKKVLGAANAKVTKGSYTLKLGSGFDTDGTATSDDKTDDISKQTYSFKYNSSKDSADLYLAKTIGYELSTDAKAINFIKKAEDKKVITINGIAKEPTVGTDVTVEGGVITIKDAALLTKITAAKPLKVTGNAYSLALDITSGAATSEDEWVIEKGKAILRRTYTNTDDGFAVAVDGKSVTKVNKDSKAVDLLTITGLDSAITADDLNADLADATSAKYVALKDGVLTIQKDAVGTSAIKLNTKGSYTLALGDGIAQSATEAGSGEGWVVKGTAATYQENIAKGYYTLDAKGTSISFTAPKNTSTTGTVTVSGLKSGLKVNADGSITGLTKTNKQIMLGSEVLGTSNITVSDNTYKLALNPDDQNIPVPDEVASPSWVLKGTNATYVQPQAKGYALDEDNNTITYTKGGNDIVMATLSGLSKNLADKVPDGTLGAKYVSVKGNVITLTNDILLEGTKSVKLKNGKQADGKTAATYTLAVNASVATEGQKVQWYVKGTTAQYINCDVAHYKAKGDTQFDFVAAAPASGAKAQITLEGINNKTVTVDNDGTISNVSIVGKVVKLTEDALNKKTVKLTGDGYTLDVTGTDVYEDAAELEATWKTSGTTAKLNQKQSKGYTLSNDKKTLSYLASSKEVTLATVKGLKSGQKLDETISGSKTELDLAGEKLSAKVTVDGLGYSFKFDKDFKGEYNATTEKVTYSTITGSKNIDNITVDGAAILVNAGKGDDYVDLGTTRKLTDSVNSGNVLQFVSGDGDDTVANYKTGDTIKISNITAKNVEDGKYEVTTTVDGNDIVFSLNKKGRTADKDVIDTITLKGAKDQTVTVVDKSDVVIPTATATASEFIGSGNVAEEFYSDNYIGSANDLGDIISGDATFSVGDIETSDATDLTKQNTTTIVASTGK